jgi:hypothetical protein
VKPSRKASVLFQVILLIFSLASGVATAQIPGGGPVFGTKEDVKDIISHFRAEMSALISQAGGEARVTLVRAMQVCDELISSLTVAYADSVRVTFGELDKQEQKTFSDTRHLLDELGREIRGPTDKGLQLGKDLTVVLNEFAFWTKKPLVTAVNRNYVPPASIEKTIKIQVNGLRLHAAGVDNPKLIIGDKEFKTPDEYTDVAIAFTVPRSVFASQENGTSFQSAILTLERDASGWAPWNWYKVEAIQFRILLTVLPEQLGTYTINRILHVRRPDIRELFVSPKLQAATEGSSDTKWGCYVPPEGYKFDLSSIDLKQDGKTAHKDNDTSVSTNTGGVALKSDEKLTPTHICIVVTAGVGCPECGGTTTGHLEVYKVKEVYEDVSSDEPPMPLSLGKATRQFI